MDLLARLKEQSEWHSDGHGPLHNEAAAEIERLRAALQAQHEADDALDGRVGYEEWRALVVKAQEMRRDALGAEQPPPPKEG